MKCPRRSEGSIPGLPQEDKWESDDTCSYCGSLNPDTLMSRIEKGDVEIGPTDKSYKIYVRNVGGDKFKRSYRDCPSGSTCKGPDDCTHWVTQEQDETKFYFQHLSGEQQSKFIDLHNAKKMKIGYPGRFYVPPFFAVPMKDGLS